MQGAVQAHVQHRRRQTLKRRRVVNWNMVSTHNHNTHKPEHETQIPMMDEPDGLMISLAMVAPIDTMRMHKWIEQQQGVAG